MKTIHKFIIKSYFLPFVLTFFIALFILLMQFLWKYVDDLVGKGLEWYIIVKLLFYVSATLVPLALPLSILLSSIMTFGNLGENYELAALKASGMSLQKIMMPLTITSILISIGAFYFSNIVMPEANLKMGSLLYDVRESKPSFNIKESAFYNGIDGYSIRVGKKEDDGKTIKQIMIYDHTSFNGNNKVLYADSGIMQLSPDKQFLTLTLFRGHSYEDVLNTRQNRGSHPLMRNSFKEYNLQFDLSGFKLSRTDEDLFKSNYQMLNVKRLQKGIDSLKQKTNARKKELCTQLSKSYYAGVSKTKKTGLTFPKTIAGKKDILHKIDPAQKALIFETAANITRSAKAYTESSLDEMSGYNDSVVRYKIEWHKKFTLSFACLVLFFIGAPLGAIIRKGGLGMPVVVSVLFFILFHVLSITGEKFAKENVLTPFGGMWMASAVLLPIGIFLTYKASSDSAIFDINSYLQPLKKLFVKKTVS